MSRDDLEKLIVLIGIVFAAYLIGLWMELDEQETSSNIFIERSSGLLSDSRDIHDSKRLQHTAG